ncbi:uncharacterized protein KY384_008827 [Bacidia gigantensis]|uniref:uncharacterized protein n=1 Tax=Bacidia gigantensis TaxID=2732470 RepID=UPI001D04CA86|nr:uncharacterized protein KY384_008827 [Bacidia gigantensis]KAG8526626.1 hypothetical protein KY384_008827 [Bacidia gigantensis]
MDFKLLAEYVPYKNASTANACWRSLMKKLATFEGADPTAPSAEKSNGAQKNGGGGDDGEVPGPNSKKKNEVEVKEEEDTFSVAAVKDSWEEDEDDLDAEVKEEAA